MEGANEEIKKSVYVESSVVSYLTSRSCRDVVIAGHQVMLNDPIVEEMRAHGMAFAARHGNDIGRMCAALREKDLQGREVVRKSESPERKIESASHSPTH